MRKYYPVVPVAKPRQTRSDKWNVRPAVARYRAFADLCRILHVSVEPGDHIQFNIPMPASWSDRKKADYFNEPHMAKPDLDNLLKALVDAVLPEDQVLWCLGGIEKRWSYQGSIEIYKN